MTGYDSIRRALTQRRQADGTSQRELAARIGVAESTLANWESGAAEPGATNLIAWIHALGCTITVAEVDPWRDGYLAGLQALVHAGRDLLRNVPDRPNGAST